MRDAPLSRCALLISTLLALAGCRQEQAPAPSPAAGKEPVAVYQLYIESLAKGEGEIVWALMTEKLQGELTNLLAEMVKRMPDDEFRHQFGSDKEGLTGLTGKALFLAFLAKATFPAAKLPGLEELRVQAESDTRVQVHSARTGAQCSTPLVRQGEVWLLDGPGACRTERKVGGREEPAGTGSKQP